MSRGLMVFENSHSTMIMLFLLEHDGCRKCELYDGVCRNCRMPRKLDDLEDEGLLVQERIGGVTLLHMTDKGRKVAEALREADRLMNQE